MTKATPQSVMLLAAGTSLACSGCVQHVEHDEAMIYTYTGWASTWLILAAALLLYFGLRWLFKKSWRWYFRALGGVGVLLGLFVAIAILPADFLDSLRLDNQRVAGRFGLWWRPTEYDVPFAELESLQFRVVRSDHYKGPAPSYWMDITYRDGRRESLPMGDLLQSAAQEIRKRATQAGVRVGNLPINM